MFIAIGHLGIEGTDSSGNPTGPLTDFANAVNGFHLILGDHTNVVASRVLARADGDPRRWHTHPGGRHDLHHGLHRGHQRLHQRRWGRVRRTADGQGDTRHLMANDLVEYITAQRTITPTVDGRIDDINQIDA